MTDALYKAQAKRLAENLSRVHGVKLKHASILEAIAAIHGRPDWNTLIASGTAGAGANVEATTDTSTAATLPAATRAPAGLNSTFESWVRQAQAAGASAMDIRPNVEGFEVFMRVEGLRRLLHTGPLAEYGAIHAFLCDAAKLDPTKRFQHAGSASFAGLAELRLTVNTHPIDASDLPHLFVRWNGPKPQYQTLDELGLSTLSAWQFGISQPSGLCVVAGVTGSGRSSTLVATARALVAEGRRVMVLSKEIDPRWVPGATFGHEYREAGDVVVLDEIRDVDRADFAFEIASYGVLVVASVHARDAQMALARLRVLGLNDSRLDAVVNVVMAQLPVRKVCGCCRGAGCSKCQMTGYHGKVVLSEAIVAAPGRPITMPQQGKNWSGRTLLDDGVDKHVRQLTTTDELLRTFGDGVKDRLG